jgi:hypothetical protein
MRRVLTGARFWLHRPREIVGVAERRSNFSPKDATVTDRRYSRLAKRQVRLDPSNVRFVNLRSLAQLPFAFRILCRKQMAARGLRSQNLAARGDLESFRDCFACFAASDWLRHKARKIM